MWARDGPAPHRRPLMKNNHTSERRKIMNDFKQASERAVAEFEQMSAILGTAGDGVITADLESLIKSFNPGAETLFGWSESEVLGKPLTMLMPERYRERHLAGMARFRASGEGKILNQWLRLHALNRTGEEFPIELKISAFQTTGRWVSAILRDLSKTAGGINGESESTGG